MIGIHGCKAGGLLGVSGVTTGAGMAWMDYQIENFYDEAFVSEGHLRPGSKLLFQCLCGLSADEMGRYQTLAEAALYRMGITFAIYGGSEGAEKILPFDIVPRIVESSEWAMLERGLKQRAHALNLFIGDIYGPHKILRDGIVPRDLVLSAPAYRKECQDLRVPHGVWNHISGTDLIRDQTGQFYVLEDNLRCPSGVSYVLQNRRVLKRTLPRVFDVSKVRAVDDYPSRLLEVLEGLAIPRQDNPVTVVLTPGIHNSAYFEHAFLAQQMGVELVEGRDLVVHKKVAYMKTTRGLRKVDVIYRRIDDDFLDPLVFRPDSCLGVPGLMECYRAGNVALANAPGTGIADDKALYAYIPRIIKYYLGEEALIPNVPTYLCYEKKERDYVLANLSKMVVKATDGSGGYGMLIGPAASPPELALFRERILAEPRRYVAQPTIALSRAPVLAGDHFEGRHVDLRPFVLYGRDIYVLPGGLTRVALKKGSLVVNSSQGGGSKDTWVLHD